MIRKLCLCLFPCLGLAGAFAETKADKKDWWSFNPIVKASVPAGSSHPIDAFVTAKLTEKGWKPAPEADARTLCRRLYFDLTGLPPSPEEVDTFVRQFTASPTAYSQLVDQLLASPRYGERWARHWLDVVHFGETHGYDKDQPRPNAWPYRDYVIRAFNEDKPYAQFVQEQIAGDALFPQTRDGIEAMGFISAGPWDLIGHAEVSEEKTDGKIARHLDRDDMVANTINTFCSLTVHCAQCHDHKFDPISAADYYGLQSDFAALDRADRTYDVDPEIAEQRTALEALAAPLREQLNALNERARTASGEGLKALEKTLADARLSPSTAVTQGWHSKMESTPDVIKWVQVDLGTAALTRQVILHPCSDSYNSIGDGFGFPVRFKIEAANDPEFKTGVTLIADATAEEVPNPGIRTQTFPAHAMARYVRLTVTTLGSRKDGFMVALAEMEVLDEAGKNLTTGSQVTSLDSIEAGGRWSTAYLGDGHYPGSDPAKITPTANTKSQIEKLEQARMLMLEAMLGEKDLATFRALTLQLADVAARQQALPPAQLIYAGTIHHGSGTFLGTGAQGGKPRAVTVLMRGDVKHPGPPATPGALKAIAALPGEFSLPPDAPESARRVALARWLTAAENPLTWRSIVNRVWQYHFGHGLVETANDFGHMGAFPTHPELLDWLAATFRDDLHGSLKELHRLIVTSATYRQSSLSENPAAAESDADNHLLWRQNRRKLEAEAVRDSVLAVAGKLDLRMGGPSFQDFVITHPEHSPHYEYDQADPENPALHRRSVYRFLVRSQQQPWMATLDCADPSMLVERRNQTITPLQALAQLNNALMLTMARHFAERLEGLESTLPARIDQAFQLALQRPPTADEHAALLRYATDSGLANACRVLFNLNEFTFVD